MTQALREATVVIGAAGINGTGLTSAEKTNITNRLTTLEGQAVPANLADLANVSSTVPTTGQYLRWTGSAWAPYTIPVVTVAFSVAFTIDGGSSVLTTGHKAEFRANFAATITGYTLMANTSGSVVLDVWKDVFANWPPNAADSITGSANPTLSGASLVNTTTLTGWNTTINSGDYLRVNVDSASTVTRVTLQLNMTRTLAVG
jgi:hypothetical protein